MEENIQLILISAERIAYGIIVCFTYQELNSLTTNVLHDIETSH